MAQRESTEGLLGSLRNLAATLVAVIQTRVEILKTELEEEKLRIGQTVLLAIVSIIFASLGVILLAVLVVVLFWDTHRVTVLLSLTGVFFGGALVAGWCCRMKAKAGTKLFATSVSELAKDRDQLTRKS
jgi:uncharacterized membrane protein YqjE